jgi:hypothetical protein
MSWPRVLAAIMLLCFWGGGPAAAQRLADSELAQIRAGYADPSGLTVSLGAVMKSYVDGSLVLESTMTVNAAGIDANPQLGAGANALSPAALGALPAQTGAVLAGDGGTTSFLHGLSDRGLTNMVINTANGRDIVQTTAVTVGIPNLPQLQQQAALAGFATQLHDMLGTSLLNAAPR